MQATILGLVLFAATTSPGFFWLLAADKRRPSRTQTPLRETSELFVVGSTASLIALLVCGSIAEASGWGDTRKLFFQTSSYIERSYLGLAGAGLAAYVAACGIAYFAARLRYRGKKPLVDESAWFQAFRSNRPSDMANAVIVKTKGGKTYSGFLDHYTADNSPVDERELIILSNATMTGMPGGYAEGVTGTAQVVISGADISTIEVFHIPIPGAT